MRKFSHFFRLYLNYNQENFVIFVAKKEKYRFLFVKLIILILFK